MKQNVGGKIFIMAESKLSLIQKENLGEIIHNLLVIFGSLQKGYKDRDVVTNAWQKYQTPWILYMMERQGYSHWGGMRRRGPWPLAPLPLTTISTILKNFYNDYKDII